MKNFTIAFLLSLVSITLYAQNTLNFYPDNSYRRTTLDHYYKMVGWDDSQYKEFALTVNDTTGRVVDFMNWRAIFPPGYDKNDGKKYPMILMLHGAGESGRSWSGRFTYSTSDVRYDNNGHNLLHGGEAHRNAVNLPSSNSRSFPGIVIFPQVKHSGSWESGWNSGILSPNAKMATDIVEYMIANYGADDNRVYVHGLSNGGKGTWDIASKRPDLFAAILPMSGVARSTTIMTDILLTTPTWLFQGGLDANPSPTAAQNLINTIVSKGGTPRYTLYPETGHGTWYQAYAEADFFSWMLQQDKRKIFVFGGTTDMCIGSSIKLGFSAGFKAYQWTRNGEDIAGANTRYFQATDAGTYTVKFQRNNDQWYESFPVNITQKPASTYSPVLTNTGSVVLPIDISAKNTVDLVAPVGFTEYNWYKNGVKLATTTTNTRNIALNTGSSTNAGDYYVQVKETSGCQSLASNVIKVVYTSPHVGPTAPVLANPVATSINQVSLTWAESPGEEYYEIWRTRTTLNAYTSEGYKLVGKVSADVLSFTDNGLRPFAQYRYRIRAIGGNDGKFSSEKSITMPNDLEAPTAPTNLLVSTIVDLKGTLSWTAASDNDLVASYEVFYGETLAGTSTTTSFAMTNLIPGDAYTVNVRAVDGRGNRSSFATTSFIVPSAGLFYSYFETGSLSSLASFDFTIAPTKSGTVNNFDISVRNRNDQFAFSFDGFIQIDEPGAYTFFTSSDDGSRLYIEGILVVDNDGLHGTQERSGVYTFGSAGRYAIKVTFFENGGGEVLTVSYDPPSAAKQLIPSGKLFLIGNSGSSSARKADPTTIEAPQDETNSSGLAVYPNPFTDRISVTHTTLQTETVRIYNHLGALVKTIEPGGAADAIDVKDLPKGIYYLSVGETKVRLLKRD
jgi:predicted esterase